MQVLLISLAMGVFLHDAIREGLGGTQGTSSLGVGWGWDWRWVVGGAAVGKMLLGVWYWWVCRRALKALADEPGRTMRRLGRRTLLAHLLIGSLYVGDLVAGLLVVIRERVVSTISVDELLVMGPTLGLIVWLWWAYYPVERRLREAGVFERVEAGEPVYPVPTRGGYVVAQCRHVLMLLFVPLVLILGWVEVVHRMQARGWVSEMWVGPATAGGAGVVFVLAPLMIRHLWDTIPLPEGPTRRRLVELCEMHAVRVRELLLWRTYAAGGVLNAGVMGVVGRLRYIMLSDALLEMLTPEQVEAVMAHELAHAKRRHMLWLPLAAIGSLGLLELSLGTLTAAASASLPAGWAVFPPGSLWGGGGGWRRRRSTRRACPRRGCCWGPPWRWRRGCRSLAGCRVESRGRRMPSPLSTSRGGSTWNIPTNPSSHATPGPARSSPRPRAP